MTAVCEEDCHGDRASADGITALRDENDATEAATATAPSVTRVPLHGPVDSHDVMCAKVIFALCGSVFPHPLLLAQQLLGIEDQDFPEFQLNVAEAGNNCIDIVAAYLTNLRVLQLEEEPNPPVSLSMIQPRHAATVASVAAKARDLLSELALARATVKPRKAPKNKAIESAARAAAAAVASSTPGTGTLSSSLGAGAAVCSSTSSSTMSSSGEVASSSTTSLLPDAPSDAVPSFLEDVVCSDSNDESSSSCGPGHQDTSRDSNTPRTAREEEERLLVALQGPAAAEETLRMARARPSGCKGGPTSTNDPKVTAAASDGQVAGGHPPSASTAAASTPLHQPASAAASGSTGSPRAGVPPPPPPPVRTTSAMAQYASGQASGGVAQGPAGGSGGASQRYSQEVSRGGSGGRSSASNPGSALQTALSCPVTGLPDLITSSSPPNSAMQAAAGAIHATGTGISSQTGLQQVPSQPTQQQVSHQGHRRNGGAHQQQQQAAVHGSGGSGIGGGRRGHNHHTSGNNSSNIGGAGTGMRAPAGMQANLPSVLSIQQQQQSQQQSQQQQAQQQHLAVAQLLGLRTSFGNSPGNPYGNLAVNLQGAAYAAGGLSPFSPAASAAGNRLDLGSINHSMAATNAALELAAAQQAAAISAAAASAGLQHQLGHPHQYGFGAGFGSQVGSLQATMPLGQLAGQLGSAGAALGGLGGASLVAGAGNSHHHHQHQQHAAAAAAAAAALLQQSGGMIHLTADSLGGPGAGGDHWSNVLLQAQLAGSLT